MSLIPTELLKHVMRGLCSITEQALLGPAPLRESDRDHLQDETKRNNDCFVCPCCGLRGDAAVRKNPLTCLFHRAGEEVRICQNCNMALRRCAGLDQQQHKHKRQADVRACVHRFLTVLMLLPPGAQPTEDATVFVQMYHVWLEVSLEDEKLVAVAADSVLGGLNEHADGLLSKSALVYT